MIFTWPITGDVTLIILIHLSCKAAAAAKLLQSCSTLCDPRDGSLPGSSVPGILQARTLEWVAISFSNVWEWKMKMKSLSRVWLFGSHGLQPIRLLRPWDFPSKSTGVGCHCLLQEKLYTVSQNKTGSWLWLRSWTPYCQIQTEIEKVGKTTRPFRYDLNQIPYNYTVEVRNRFKGLDLRECLLNYGRRFVTLYRRQGSRLSPWKRNAKKQNDCLRRSYK